MEDRRPARSLSRLKPYGAFAMGPRPERTTALNSGAGIGEGRHVLRCRQLHRMPALGQLACQ